MAIYKPTNCTPFLTTFDLRVESRDPAFFECRIDSSNRNVAAYSVVVYDEDNVQVFPIDASGNPVPADQNISFVSYLGEKTGNNSTQYLINNTGYSYLNTGINGTYLRIPFVVNVADAVQPNNALYFKSTNALYYDPSNGTLKAYTPQTVGVDENGKRKEPSGDPTIDLTSYIQNGYTYKWRITLYQGDTQGNVPPSSILYYDMLLTSGQTLGSNTERIQSVLSDEIYIDYYVQPVHIDGLSAGAQENPAAWTHTGEITNVGPRARIKNYDPTYGYIYPQTGSDGISTDAVDQKAAHEGKDTVANGFRVFSMSNNPENLAVTRKVYTVFSNICVPFTWQDYASDPSQSYGNLIYYVFPSDNGNPQIENSWGWPEGTKYRIGTDTNSYMAPFSLARLQVIPVTPKEGEEGEYDEQQPVWAWVAVTPPESVSTYARTECSTDVTKGARFILNAQFDNPSGDPPIDENSPLTTWQMGAQYATSGSRYNGLFSIAESIDGPEVVEFRLTSGGTVYTINQYSVMFQRTTDADTWGEIYNKIVYVEGGSGIYQGTNVQIQREEGEDDNANGTINSTPMKWGPEIPLNIYDYTGDALTNNPDINSVGLIFYNDYWEDDTSSYEGRLYLRPYVGLTRGMYWQEQGPVRSTNMRQFVIDEVNTDYWYVKYHFRGVNDGSANFNASNSLIDIGTRYQIKSYFRESDENPFDLYANPDIEVHFYPSESEKSEASEMKETENIGDEVVTLITRRSFWAEATFTQVDYISWKSYRWFLYSGLGTSGRLLQSTDTEYGGIPANLFYGLQNNTYYTVVLIMESNTGATMQKNIAIRGSFSTPELENFPFSLSYDCASHSATLSFSVTGYVLPNASRGNNQWRYQNSSGDDTVPSIDGVTYSDGSMNILSSAEYDYVQGVEYAYVLSLIQMQDAGSYLQYNPTTSDNPDMVAEAEIVITSAAYCGQIFGFETGLNEGALYLGYASLELPEALENVTKTYSTSDAAGVLYSQKIARPLVVENTIYSFVCYTDAGQTIPIKVGSPLNLAAAKEDGRWDEVVIGAPSDEKTVVTHPLFISNMVAKDLPGYKYNDGTPVKGEPLFDDCVNIVAQYTKSGETLWEYAWEEGEGDPRFDYNISFNDSENKTIKPPVTETYQGWTGFQVTEGLLMVGNEEFHTRGPASFIWSDFNLITRKIAMQGQKQVVFTSGEEEGEISSDNPSFQGYKALEDYDSVWVWDDSGVNAIWSDGNEATYTEGNKKLDLVGQKRISNSAGATIYSARQGLQNKEFKIKVVASSITSETSGTVKVFVGYEGDEGD